MTSKTVEFFAFAEMGYSILDWRDMKGKHLVCQEFLVVYNMCGLRGNENSDYYIRAINSILNQTYKSTIVLSGCCLSETTKVKLQTSFGDKVSFFWIDKIYPVPVTFNAAVLMARQTFGPYEGYMYVDSGCVFTKSTDMESLYRGFSKDVGMYAARVDHDSGYEDWFGNIITENDMFPQTLASAPKLLDFTIPLGKTVNLHTQVFSESIVEAYGRPYPDIFAGYCSESVFSFLCAAIKTKFKVCGNVVAHHQHLDGQSAGFHPAAWQAQGKNTLDHPYLVDSIVEIMKRGQEFGLGYEELHSVVMHDEKCFDKDGFSTDGRLAHFIKENLFLQPDKLNYDTIMEEATFIC